MKRIVVFHPQNSQINGGHTEFSGKSASYKVDERGVLHVLGWQTEREQGLATFAAGQWAYVCDSGPRYD